MIRMFDTKVDPLSDILRRDTEENARVDQAVDTILQDVKTRGDAALIDYAQKFDRAALTELTVSNEEMQRAADTVGPAFLATLNVSAANIRAFHEKQVRRDFVMAEMPGVVLGQRILPIAKAGIYVPGGRASYPSTVLMNAIPAKIAGVESIFMATPPRPDGTVAPAILAAAGIAGVDRVFKMGGAQGIAAFAYGTETVPRVDKIVGPGNMYVAAAKAKVFGQVSIDMIAGPSEILVIGDEGSNPAWIAADLLSQAEHDPMSMSVLLTDCPALGAAVRAALEEQMTLLPKGDICRTAIEQNGKIVITRDLTEAVQISNQIAPEHLELCVQEPFAMLPLVKNAGSVFLGRYAPEALGDYFAGPNHTLPTSGTARFSSPLGVDDFVKKSSFTYYTEAALEAAAGHIVPFAQAEGLDAHARSVTIRLEKGV